MEKIKIGNSDYTRKQMEQDDGNRWVLGVSSEYFLDTIKEYESQGYTVKFETSLFRRIFGVGIYKVVAYK